MLAASVKEFAVAIAGVKNPKNTIKNKIIFSAFISVLSILMFHMKHWNWIENINCNISISCAKLILKKLNSLIY